MDKQHYIHCLYDDHIFSSKYVVQAILSELTICTQVEETLGQLQFVFSYV